ncbi:histidine permease [Scheffersomyces stipitis CBS 6054]|uniref:Histidine permease n=1 Tax=Scheffersomyces stipitis (strain ATCC 58785 / CBS 6054 / NBRC 10063 / NRRL Y-11545) TaxID=322104 RepID=A3GHU4_PICST|nr:histidine permease [Scheffersomyces stipitis CBS 6054]EAZ63114.1 histidine permease [Scheffersomyces stipitis CBS 6054]
MILNGTTSDLEVGKEIQITTLDDNLRDYQVKLIALGSCIGSGLFISSASALSTAGPAGCIIGYVIVAFLIFFIVQALGELTSSYPVRGNFLAYSTKFIDESWGFAMNWNYCLQWLVTTPLSLVSASLTIEFWHTEVNTAVFVAIFYVIICIINIFGVRGYGYGESFFSVIKVVGILGFCVLAIVLIAGGGEQGYIGAKFWHNPGAFANSFHGVCNTLVNATFSFAGTELVAIAAASSPNPRRALNKALKQIFWRITVFYMLAIILICFLVPYNDPSLMGNSGSSASPFVIAIKNGGIKALPSIFNVIILLAVLSVANASVFASYRPLVALAEAGHGPKFLAYVDKKGRPIYSIMIALAFGLIGFVCASSQQATVFNWLLALSGLSTIFIWFSISLAQVRVNYACKVQGISTDNVPFKAMGGDYGAYFSMFVNILILIAQFYVALYPVGGEKLNANTFFQAYLAAPVVLFFYIIHKVWTRNWSLYIKADQIDVTTGRNIIDMDLVTQELYEEKTRMKEQPWYSRFFNFWC